MKIPHVRFASFFAAAYRVALVLVAFGPRRWTARSLHAHGLPQSLGYGQLEFGVNITLFIPRGYIAGRLFSRKWWCAPATGFAVSCLIEVGKSLLLPDRFASVLDIVASTLGAGILAVCVGWRSGRTARTEPGSAQVRATQAPLPVEPSTVGGPSVCGQSTPHPWLRDRSKGSEASP